MLKNLPISKTSAAFRRPRAGLGGASVPVARMVTLANTESMRDRPKMFVADVGGFARPVFYC